MSLKDPPKSTYISIREDDGLRSLSRNERAFTRECALPALSNTGRRRSLRVDGRTMDQVRPLYLKESVLVPFPWKKLDLSLVEPKDRPSDGNYDLYYPYYWKLG